MFSILKKPQNTINADDLELLQNEIERHLVNNVKQRWKLERLSESSSIISPELSTPLASGTGGDGTTSKCTTTSSQSANLPTGKLRNSMKLSHIDAESEDATDGFKNSIYATNNTSNGTTNGPNSNETDSISSESSLTSILTGSTIITGNLADSNQLPATNKRGLKNSTADRPSKRFRHNNSNSVPTPGGLPKRPPHSKHRSKIIPSKFRNSIEESRPNKKQVLKNEAPDKLWPFVEQFCLPPTEKQIEELEEMLESMENDQDYYKVPPSLKQESSESPAKADATINNHVNSNKNQRKSKSKTYEDASLGALTQRLVSSFIEETEDNSPDQSRSGSDTSSPPTKKRKSKVSKCLDADNANNVEKRIRQQLEAHSILTPQDDIPYTSEQNETLRELAARQHELLSVQTDIKQTIKTFINEAKRRNALDAMRAELEEANANVRSAYYRYISAKQKKRNPTKKERDAAYKAVKDHQEIFEKCDALYRIVNRSSDHTYR